MEQKYIDFVKALEESKIVKKGSHNNNEVMKVIKQVCNLSEDEIKKETNPTVIMIHDEYTDWIETYKG